MATTQPATYRERLEAARARLAAIQESERLERELRDRVTVEAIDTGCTYREVAQWAGISRAQVGRILSGD